MDRELTKQGEKILAWMTKNEGTALDGTRFLPSKVAQFVRGIDKNGVNEAFFVLEQDGFIESQGTAKQRKSQPGPKPKVIRYGLTSEGRDAGLRVIAANEAPSREDNFYAEKNVKGWTYIVQADAGGPVKIGQTVRAVYERVRVLQTGCPVPLRVIAILEGVEQEAILHRKFKRYKLRGEWFHYSEEIKTFVERFQQKVAGSKGKIHAFCELIEHARLHLDEKHFRQVNGTFSELRCKVQGALYDLNEAVNKTDGNHPDHVHYAIKKLQELNLLVESMY